MKYKDDCPLTRLCPGLHSESKLKLGETIWMRCSSDGGGETPTGMEAQPAYFSMFHAVSQTVPMAGTNEQTMHIYNHVIPYIYI